MSMAGYTKLFNSILASTIWLEDDKTRLVWITLLAMADKDGIAEGSIPGIASFAKVSTEDCRAAIRKLTSPDEDSRSKEYGGRRIEEIDGGFRLLNHEKYRKRLSADERREYLRTKQREYRSRDKATFVNNVSDTDTRLTQAEAEAKAKEERLREEEDAKSRARAEKPSTLQNLSPSERMLDAYRAHWKRVYRQESSLLLKSGEVVNLLQQLTSVGELSLMKALAAYFDASDPFLRQSKHPFALFLKEPTKYLAGAAQIAKRPVGCKHDPVCEDEAAHTRRKMAEKLEIPVEP